MTDRGAGNGPPVAVRAKDRELRIGPLPETSLFGRLRANWSFADLLPPLDPHEFTAPQWRRAAGLAIAVHVALVGAIVGASYLGLWDAREGPERPEIIRVLESTPPDPSAPEPKTTEGGSETAGGDGNIAAGSSSGGSNTSPAPVTAGTPPPSTPAPIVTPTIAPPPLVAPSLPVTPSVDGPRFDVPSPDRVGLPNAPPAPGEPSLGNGGGNGVGDGKGSGAGNGTGPGANTGAGGTNPGGVGSPNGSAANPNNPPGPGPGPGSGAAPVANRRARLAKPVRPVATPAMIEAGTSGTVTFEVQLGPDGSIRKATPIQTLPNGGTQAALKALYKCGFLPAIENGQYVASTIIVRFDSWTR